MRKDFKSGISHGFIGMPPDRSEAAVGGSLSHRLYRSCLAVEATCGPAQRHFEAYPGVCHDPDRCAVWRSCWLMELRAQVVQTARGSRIVKTRRRPLALSGVP